MISQRALEVIAEKAAEGDAAIAVVMTRDVEWNVSLAAIAALFGGAHVTHSSALIQWDNNSCVKVFSSSQENADSFRGCRYDLLVFDTHITDMSVDAYILLCSTAKEVCKAYLQDNRQAPPEKEYVLQYIHPSDEGLLLFYGDDGMVTSNLESVLMFTLDEALDHTANKESWILRRVVDLNKISRRVVKRVDLLGVCEVDDTGF